MMQHDQLGLLENRLGRERYRRLIERLDATFEGAPAENTNESAASRILAASEFFRTLVERQIDWLEEAADLRQPTIDLILLHRGCDVSPRPVGSRRGEGGEQEEGDEYLHDSRLSGAHGGAHPRDRERRLYACVRGHNVTS